jgi:NADP-dependent 3-hydroxy acid dehydrogenase YdfG
MASPDSDRTIAASKEKMIMGPLDGKTTIVTGAGSGIGKASAKLLAADGATVALVGRRLEVLDEVAHEITAAGLRAIVVPTHIESRDEVAELVRHVRNEAGPVDILVNNAGSASKTRNVRWIPDEEWLQVIEVNLNAVYLLTQAVLPDMLERGSGTIITISSLAAVNPSLLGGAAYGAAKAAARNFMVYLHNTFSNDGIRATCILPGEVDTPIMNNRPRPPTEDERAGMVHPEDVARAVHLAASLPDRTVISELVIAPRHQRDISADLEVSRWLGAPANLAAARTADSSPR